jgi:hypothetical protein
LTRLAKVFHATAGGDLDDRGVVEADVAHR